MPRLRLETLLEEVGGAPRPAELYVARGELLGGSLQIGAVFADGLEYPDRLPAAPLPGKGGGERDRLVVAHHPPLLLGGVSGMREDRNQRRGGDRLYQAPPSQRSPRGLPYAVTRFHFPDLTLRARAL